MNVMTIIKGRQYKKGEISWDNIDWFVHITNIWAPYNIDINIKTSIKRKQFIFIYYIYFL